MLENARKYEKQLNEKMWDTWYDPAYQFYWIGRDHSNVTFQNSDKYERQFVSIDPHASEDKRVIGYLSCYVNINTNAIDGLGAINFVPSMYGKNIFGRDLWQFVDDLLMRDKFNRLQFGVVVGNPAEAMYNKYVKKLGGRVVGIFRQSCLGAKGELLDEKVYEILRIEYAANRRTL